MFPWTGNLEIVARNSHYTRDMITHLLSHASKLGIHVIPLIQTFGHMEFVLKHEPWRHLRDVEQFPNCLRPLCVDTEKEEVRMLVTEMIRQVAESHSDLNTIHLGCDEVWSLGQSLATQEYMEKMSVTVTDIFLDHVTSVANIAKTLVPGVKVMVWDDMMRNASVDQLLKRGLDKLVKPVIWNYGSIFAFPTGMLERYQTVWARYDHYATLCELLPVSLPSLKCCLTVLNKKAWSIDLHRDVSSSLGLSRMLGLDPYSNQNANEDESLTIPGNIIYSSMTAYAKLARHYEAIMSSSAVATWLNPWQLKQGFLNPLQVRE